MSRYNDHCIDCGIELLTLHKLRCESCKIKKRQAINKANKLKHNYNNTPEKIYANYKKRALKKELKFELELKDFQLMWNKPCVYCGTELQTVGFDRVDSNKGYTKDNIVLCCKICNMMKYTTSKEAFIKQCLLIVNHYNKYSK